MFRGICWVSFQLLVHSKLCYIPIVVTGWQILHHPPKSSWRWLGGTGLTLSRSSHSSTPRRKVPSAAPYIHLGSWGARLILARRLEGLHEVSPGRRRSTNTRSPGVGKVQELPGPVIRRGLGGYDLVRVRRGSTV